MIIYLKNEAPLAPFIDILQVFTIVYTPGQKYLNNKYYYTESNSS